jgi:hypothetical protein
MNLQPDSSFAAYVGIDWADKKHDFCLQASGSRACYEVETSGMMR